jgi:hypothetical protein
VGVGMLARATIAASPGIASAGMSRDVVILLAWSSQLIFAAATPFRARATRSSGK